MKIENCNLLGIEDVNILTIFKSKETILALLACAIGMYNVSFFAPFFSIVLESYDLSVTEVGYCYTLGTFPYLLAIFVTGMLCKKVPRKI